MKTWPGCVDFSSQVRKRLDHFGRMINKQLSKKYWPFFLSIGDYDCMLSAFSFEFNTQSSQLKTVIIQKDSIAFSLSI